MTKIIKHYYVQTVGEKEGYICMVMLKVIKREIATDFMYIQ